MAYIDREKLKMEIRKSIDQYYNEGAGGYYLAEDVIDELNIFPTADVVPRSEVEKAKQEVASEIFEELERFLFKHKTLINITEYAELKKEYIGEVTKNEN